MTDEELDQEEARILKEIEEENARKRGAVLSFVPRLDPPKGGDGEAL